MATRPAPEELAPCPGCGGHGKFEWSANPKVPKGWGTDAPCRMCRGTGKVPASWLKKPSR
jgi:DnaJ-class molecular chaperone